MSLHDILHNNNNNNEKTVKKSCYLALEQWFMLSLLIAQWFDIWYNTIHKGFFYFLYHAIAFNVETKSEIEKI